MAQFTAEPDGSHDHGPCPCCGSTSRTVWGYLTGDGRTAGVYYVHWTVGRVDHGANFDIVIGRWGEGSSPADRSNIAVAFRLMPEGPQFMVVDAGGRPLARRGSLAANSLRRDQVIGTPVATEVFAMLDAIWVQDHRICELAGAH